MNDEKRVPNREESELACRILSYLLENENAQDTEEGAWWWALEEEIKVKMASVSKSLSALVAQGLVVEKHGADGKVHYALNENKRETARRVVQSGRLSEDL